MDIIGHGATSGLCACVCVCVERDDWRVDVLVLHWPAVDQRSTHVLGPWPGWSLIRRQGDGAFSGGSAVEPYSLR